MGENLNKDFIEVMEKSGESKLTFLSVKIMRCLGAIETYESNPISVGASPTVCKVKKLLLEACRQ